MATVSASQSRRSTRSKVMLTASLEVTDNSFPVKLRDLSTGGALVEADVLPLLGTEVIFDRNGLRERARVVWTQGNHAGVAFNEKLKPEQVLRDIPPSRPRMLGAYRRPGLACRHLTPEQRQLVESWIRLQTW